jgi:LmbE family N-acetylglucosaminyl deacetylase
VVSQSPRRTFDRIYANHPDHLAAGEAALCAVYPDARNPFAHSELAAEGWDEWTVPEVWVMSTQEADTYVDITDRFDAKVAALLCHESQMTDPDGVRERMRAWGLVNATNAGFGEGRLAEGFLRMETA